MTDPFDLDQALTMDYPISNTVTSITVNAVKPMSPEEKVSGMPTVGPSPGVCTVCMESLKYSSCKQTPCGHLYHVDCITRWLSSRSSCPVCRFKLPANPPVMELDSKSTHFT